MKKELLHRIKRKLTKMRLQPIRVYCLHHVSEMYDPLTMWEKDWMQLDEFKQIVLQMKASGVEFISLPEAYDHVCHDLCRSKKYAVLTFDDGYKSILNILPWLEEKQIPVTLFVNTKYLDGMSWSEINEELARKEKPDVDMLKDVCPKLYLTKEELKQVASMTNVTIGMHGHEHLDATKLMIDEFKENVEKCQEALMDVLHTIPYFAYTWGKHNAETEKMLKDMGITPVYIQGAVNFNNKHYIDREELQ